MLRLADILGSVKPPTATQEEIKKSTLPVKKGFEIPKLAEDNGILALTADRCLGVLLCVVGLLSSKADLDHLHSLSGGL